MIQISARHEIRAIKDVLRLKSCRFLIKLTFGGLQQLLDFFNQPLDLAIRVVQLLLVFVEIIPKRGAVDETLGEFERR